MEALRVALIQAAWFGSREAMEAQYRKLLALAVEQGVKLVCLPGSDIRGRPPDWSG